MDFIDEINFYEDMGLLRELMNPFNDGMSSIDKIFELKAAMEASPTYARPGCSKDTPQEPPEDIPQEPPEDIAQEPPKDIPKELPKDKAQEPPKVVEIVPPKVVKIEHRELMAPKIHGYEKLPFLKAKYLNKIKSTLKFNDRDLLAVLNHLKKNYAIAYIFDDLMLFISAELQNVQELKPPIILKVSQYLRSNKMRNVTRKFIEYSYAFDKFLTDASKSYPEKYLLKDIAVDIFSEVLYRFDSKKDNAKNSPASRLIPAFQNPDVFSADFYGSTVKCFANEYVELKAPVFHKNLFFSDIFSLKMINSAKVYKKLVRLCEGYIYCCIPRDVYEERLGPPSALYNMNISFTLFYNLIRNELLTPSYFQLIYQPDELKTFHFRELRLNPELVLRRAYSGGNRNGHAYPNFPISKAAFLRQRAASRRAQRTGPLLHSEISYDICNYPWDVIFHNFVTRLNYQLEYYACFSVHIKFYDIYSYRKTFRSYVSSQESCIALTSPFDKNPFNFQLTDSDTRTFTVPRTKRRGVKRKLPPS